MYDLIKAQLTQSVPFAQHVGVALEEVGAGTATALLPSQPHLLNHIQTQHAGALFSAGETASGAAVVGAFAERMFEIRPIATEATIRYVKKAVGPIRASAQTDKPVAELTTLLDEHKRVGFQVAVTLRDESGTTVAEMTVGWLVSQR